MYINKRNQTFCKNLILSAFILMSVPAVAVGKVGNSTIGTRNNRNPTLQRVKQSWSLSKAYRNKHIKQKFLRGVLAVKDTAVILAAHLVGDCRHDGNIILKKALPLDLARQVLSNKLAGYGRPDSQDPWSDNYIPGSYGRDPRSAPESRERYRERHKYTKSAPGLSQKETEEKIDRGGTPIY